MYFERALQQGHANCAIIGISPHSETLSTALSNQDGFYTVASLHPDETRYSVIGALTHVVSAARNPSFAMDALVNPKTSLVTLTITEKGYCHRPADGKLHTNNVAIQGDLKASTSPRTTPGLLVHALRLRRERGLKPFAIMSCDNLQSNGKLTKRVLLQYALNIDPALADWIAAGVACPSTVVDRITPKTSPADRAAAKEALGVDDHCLVCTEPYSSWIIGEYNGSERIPWASMGVKVVSDVAPHEVQKLRLLNGPHSALAYLGLLFGKATIADTMDDQRLAAYTALLMTNELAPTVQGVNDSEIQRFVVDTQARFRNTGIQHQVAQIAMDGSQKLPQRLLEPLLERINAEQSIDGIVIAITAWAACVLNVYSSAVSKIPSDPLLGEFAALAECTPKQSKPLARAVLSLSSIFNDELRSSTLFADRLTHWFERFLNVGPQLAVSEYIQASQTPSASNEPRRNIV